MPITKTCRNCGTEFKVPPCRAKTAYTCSKACKYAMTPKTRSQLCKCETCGSEFHTPLSHYKRGEGRFCSRACHAVWQAASEEYSARVCGDNNPMWKGGVVSHRDGYIYQSKPQHPLTSNGYVLQHRLVMEDRMREEVPDHPFLTEGYLPVAIHVHHRDNDKANNHPGNLMAMTGEAHLRWHNSSRLPDPWECWPNIHPAA